MQKITKNRHQPLKNLIRLPTRAGRRRHNIVWQGPRLGFVAETGNFVTTGALSVIFLLFFVLCFRSWVPFSRLFLCLASYFSHFLLSYPGMFTVSSCSFVCAAVSCFYSHQVRSNVKTTTTTTNICSHVRHTYVTKGTYAFKYLYVCNRWTWYLYISCILVPIYSAWHELVPAFNSSSGWKCSLATRAHITTTLHELKTASDESRGEWRCK